MGNLIEESHGVTSGAEVHPATKEAITGYESYRARFHDADSWPETEPAQKVRDALAAAEPGDKDILVEYLAKVATTDFDVPSWEACEVLADDPTIRQTTLNRVIEDLRRKGATVALAIIEDRWRRCHVKQF